MGESLGRVGQNVSAQAAAAQSSEDLKKKIEKDKKTKAPAKNLGLKGVPKAADQKVPIEEKKDVAKTKETDGTENATEAAESILTEMDKQLNNVQKGLKDFIGKKIKLASKNPAKGKDLLASAYHDTKKAYDKIKKIREQLA